MKHLPSPYLSLAIHPSDWRRYRQWSVLPGCGGRTGNLSGRAKAASRGMPNLFWSCFLRSTFVKSGVIWFRLGGKHVIFESNLLECTVLTMFQEFVVLVAQKQSSTPLMIGGVMPGVGIFLFPLVKMMFCETSGSSWTRVRSDRLWREKTQPTRCKYQSYPNFIKSSRFLVPKHQPSDRSFLPDSGILPGSEQFGRLNLSTRIGQSDNPVILWGFEVLFEI